MNQKTIGASKCAAVLGVDPYVRPIDVYANIVDGIPIGNETHHTERGVYLEDGLRQWYASRVGKTINKGFTKNHPLCARLHATPDGIESNGAWGFDAKCPDNSNPNSNWDELPDHYVIQGTVQCSVFDFPRVDFGCLIGGDLKVFPVRHDRDLAGYIIERVQKFWIDHIDKKVPPPVDGSASWDNYLKQKFPSSTDDMMESTREIDTLASILEQSTKMRLAASKTEADVKNKLKAILREHEGVAGRWGKVYYRNRKDREYIDYEQLLVDLNVPEDVLRKYTRITPGPRVFRAYWRKGEDNG